MSRAIAETEAPGVKAAAPPLRDWAGLLVSVAVSGAVVTLVLLAVVAASRSAWELLGVGRGLIPEDYYHVSGFVITLATTFGQAVGWAGGSALAYHVLTTLGLPPGLPSARVAMSVVYLGLATAPLVVYHVVFGGPLLGLPRVGLEEFLLAQYPDAHWLLIRAHPVIELSLVPLTLLFLAVLWLTGDRPLTSRAVQTVLALAVLGGSLAVALSLAIHSTLVHIRL